MHHTEKGLTGQKGLNRSIIHGKPVNTSTSERNEMTGKVWICLVECSTDCLETYLSVNSLNLEEEIFSKVTNLSEFLGALQKVKVTLKHCDIDNLTAIFRDEVPAPDTDISVFIDSNETGSSAKKPIYVKFPKCVPSMMIENPNSG